MVWMLWARAPPPDASYWPGRRGLAAVDAVLWPVLWVLMGTQIPSPIGLVVPLLGAVAFVCALNRLYRALWINHRYRFTTWRWVQIFAVLLLVAVVLRLGLLA
jgi:hypothetical protein